MAIDRGPWNALIDDDGSNLVGSLWNKAAIKTVLLDPIDARDPWVDVPFAASNFGPSDAAGSWTVTAGQQITFCTRRTGQALEVAFYIQSSAVTNANGLRLLVPVGLTWRNQTSTVIGMQLTGVPSVLTGVALTLVGQNAIVIYRDYAISPILTGAATVAGTVTIPL